VYSSVYVTPTGRREIKRKEKKYIKQYVKFYQQKDRNKQNEKENPFGFVKTLVEEKSNGTV
jgi:hypothetical protein